MKADPRLVKLLETARELHDKQASILAELATLINGGEGIGPKITRLKQSFSLTWEVRHGSRYIFTNHPAVGAAFKRWLMAGFSTDEIEARMVTYIGSSEPFYLQKKHPIELFIRGFNSFVGAVQRAELDSKAPLRLMRGEP